jgi:acyl-CoA synthetase (AMP-forming)/AMP-acid ligase II
VTQMTMLGELRRSCREWPDRTALVADDATMTYRALWSAVTDLAALYRRLGVRPGDRVVCALPNCPEHLVAMGAAWACGAAHVAAGIGATAHDVAWLVGRVEARVLLAGRTAAEVPGDWPAAVRAAQPEARIATCEDAAGVAPDGEPMAEVAEEDPAVIRFSSGTTGTPKGLIARHGPTARAWTNLAGILGFGPDDAHLGHLPLAFGFGLQMGMLALLTGGRLVLMDRFRAEPARQLIERHRVTVLDGVPAGYRQLLDVAGASPAQVASLRTGIGSGDAFPPALVARIVEELGMDLVLMYGTVEGFGMLNRERRLMLAGAVGRPAAGSVLIVDAGGRPAPAGRAGEVAFRRQPGSPVPWGGDGVLPWYRTGDLGRLDRNGWLHLTGRLKHQINRGGLKVDPVEVAGHLLGCAGVADAAVVGLPDPVLGEVPCACVVPSDPDRPPTLEALQSELRRVLTPYKLPAALHLLPEIPLTGNGKADIARLRGEALAAAPPRAVAEPANGTVAAATDEPAGVGGPVTLPEIEQELARLVHDVSELRDGLDGPDRALVERIAAAAAAHAALVPATGAALPAGRFITTRVAVATDGMRAWWADLAERMAGATEVPPPARDPAAVAERLLGLARADGEAGRLAWKLFLGCAREALVPYRHLPHGPDREPAEVVLKALGELMGDTPLYVGRPAFVTDELLERLRAEAAERRSAATLDQGMLMASPGEAARRFAYRDEMRELLAGLGQRVEASGAGKYVYCDPTAKGPGEHLHEMPFVLNVELSLEHVSPGRPGAQIVLCPPFGAARPVRTRPGELVVWFAGSVSHARDEIAAGERLTGLSMFYEPVR